MDEAWEGHSQLLSVERKSCGKKVILTGVCKWIQGRETKGRELVGWLFIKARERGEDIQPTPRHPAAPVTVYDFWTQVTQIFLLRVVMVGYANQLHLSLLTLRQKFQAFTFCVLKTRDCLLSVYSSPLLVPEHQALAHNGSPAGAVVLFHAVIGGMLEPTTSFSPAPLSQS